MTKATSLHVCCCKVNAGKELRCQRKPDGLSLRAWAQSAGVPEALLCMVYVGPEILLKQCK